MGEDDSEDGWKWLNYRYVLKVEPSCQSRLSCKRNKGVRADSEVFDWEVYLIEMRKPRKRSWVRWGQRNWGLSTYPVWVVGLTSKQRYQVGTWNRNLEFRKRGLGMWRVVISEIRWYLLKNEYSWRRKEVNTGMPPKLEVRRMRRTQQKELWAVKSSS